MSKILKETKGKFGLTYFSLSTDINTVGYVWKLFSAYFHKLAGSL
jgi:hypothetical protein